jgi:hypothetical protein
MYFYKIGGTIARKIGGEPPSNEYVAIDPKSMVRHIKNGEIIEEFQLAYPIDAATDKGLMELYKETETKRLARDILFPKSRKKKIMKPKPARKIKVVKKCICK